MSELRQQLDEVRRRVGYMARRLDLRARVSAHPFQAIGAAALAGAWLGFERRKPLSRLDSTIGDLVIAAVGALVVRTVREAAFSELAGVAKQWWEDSATAHDPLVTDTYRA